MTKTDKPNIEELQDERIFWNTFRETRLAKGINVDREFAEWAADQAKRLTSPGAREDFAELCQGGCTPQVLAVIVALMRNSPGLEIFWQTVIGPPPKRQKATRTLERAAATLEEIFGGFIAMGDQDAAAFNKMGRIPVSRVVSELRFYIRFINLAESVRKDTGSHSLAEVSKYLLSSYVRRMTGSFHDRNVSGLVGELTGSTDYNEVAHRMWRLRNYRRLDKHYSWMTNILVAASVVIAHPA
ncbi:MAG: hypothetical protein WBC04_14110 [Candidatus Acidiferrales bacterium]